MAENLSRLIISTLDKFNRVKQLQSLLKICLDEFDEPSDETQSRVDLLLSTYLSQVEPWLEDLEFGLQQIRQQIGAEQQKSPKPVPPFD